MGGVIEPLDLPAGPRRVPQDRYRGVIYTDSTGSHWAAAEKACQEAPDGHGVREDGDGGGRASGATGFIACLPWGELLLSLVVPSGHKLEPALSRPLSGDTLPPMPLEEVPLREKLPIAILGGGAG